MATKYVIIAPYQDLEAIDKFSPIGVDWPAHRTGEEFAIVAKRCERLAGADGLNCNCGSGVHVYMLARYCTYISNLMPEWEVK